MTRVLLLRADATSPNLGVRVLKEGTEALVLRAFGPETTVHVQNFDGGDTGVQFNRAAVLHDVFRSKGPIKSTLRRYDLVIDVCGGDSFTDIYGLRRLALILYTQRVSQRLGVPTILGPQTIGPFERRISRRLASRSLKRMSLVFSRDKASETEAASLGRKVDLSATDVVFALPTPRRRERHGVVVNVSGLLWNENRHVDAARYRDDVRALITRLLRDGLDVTLLPHVLENPRSDNDVPPSSTIAAEFGDRLRLHVPKSLTDAREQLAGAELVIGSRMHACLNALSTGTPAIPWAYSRKFAPLLDDVGWKHLVDLRTEPDPVDTTMRILGSHAFHALRADAEAVRASADRRLAPIVGALSDARQSRG